PAYAEVIGQGLTSNFEFGQRTLIIAVSPIKILRTGEVRFTCIWTKSSCRLDGSFGLRQARWRVVPAIEVKRVMSKGELAIRIEKRGVMRDSLIEHSNYLLYLRFRQVAPARY